MPDADIGVVGLGAWGAMALWRLASRGANVVGIERAVVGHPFGSSHGGTRLFRVACWEHPGLTDVARRAAELWRELEGESGRRLLYQDGAVMIGPPDGRAVAGARAAADRAGLRVVRLDHTSLRDRFPQHAAVPSHYEGLWDPEAGYVLAEPSVTAAVEAARRSGAQVYEHTTVTGIEADKNGVSVHTPTRAFRFAQVVLAAGPWLAKLRPELPLSPQRVPMLLWGGSGAHDVQALPPFIRHVDDDRTIWGHGSTQYTPVKVGLSYDPATASAVDPDTMSRGIRPADDWRHLARILTDVLPGLGADPTDASPCMITRTSDGQFVIGRHPEDPRIVVAGGCSGHGFKHASAIGEIVARLCLDEQPFTDLGFLRPDRFIRA